eukprot:PhF_6_TR44177/c0_g1_i1/m.67702
MKLRKAFLENPWGQKLSPRLPLPVRETVLLGFNCLSSLWKMGRRQPPESCMNIILAHFFLLSWDTCKSRKVGLGLQAQRLTWRRHLKRLPPVSCMARTQKSNQSPWNFWKQSSCVLKDLKRIFLAKGWLLGCRHRRQRPSIS